MRKLKIILIILFCFILASCGSIGHIHSYNLPDRPRFAQTLVKEEMPLKDELTVVSYNVKFCLLPNAVIELFSQDKNLVHADVICLQEMCLETVQKIASALNYNYVYYPSATYSQLHLKPLIKTLVDNGFIYATKDAGWTYKYWYLFNKKVTLDHIFVRGFEVEDTGTSQLLKPSDHLPLWAKLHYKLETGKQRKVDIDE